MLYGSARLSGVLLISTMSWWFAECSALLQYVQQLFTSFAPCPHISWRCFTWSEQNSRAIEPHIVWRNQASMSAAFLKTIWKLLLLQLFDNRPIVCLKQVEYVGGKSQNIAESFQTQMTGTWFVYCARFILRENRENSLFDAWKVIKKTELPKSLSFSHPCKYTILV